MEKLIGFSEKFQVLSTCEVYPDFYDPIQSSKDVKLFNEVKNTVFKGDWYLRKGRNEFELISYDDTKLEEFSIIIKGNNKSFFLLRRNSKYIIRVHSYSGQFYPIIDMINLMEFLEKEFNLKVIYDEETEKLLNGNCKSMRDTISELLDDIQFIAKFSGKLKNR